MGGHGHSDDGPSGGHSGMRRRPIDHTRKLPLIRSQKELALDDDTKVDAEQVRLPFGTMLAAHVPGRRRSQPPNGQQPCLPPWVSSAPLLSPPWEVAPGTHLARSNFFAPRGFAFLGPCRMAVPHDPACQLSAGQHAGAPRDSRQLPLCCCSSAGATPQPPHRRRSGPAAARLAADRAAAALQCALVYCVVPGQRRLTSGLRAGHGRLARKDYPFATAPCDDATDE